MSECPNCGSKNVNESRVTEWLPYGSLPKAFEATFPAMSCDMCGFGWRDHRAEEAIDTAMNKWLEAEPPFTRADEAALSAEADYYEGKLRGDA
jgi:YgiT-type zinc finger domain-containing protein